jgi:hypothetical protein
MVPRSRISHPQTQRPMSSEGIGRRLSERVTAPEQCAARVNAPGGSSSNQSRSSTSGGTASGRTSGLSQSQSSALAAGGNASTTSASTSQGGNSVATGGTTTSRSTLLAKGGTSSAANGGSAAQNSASATTPGAGGSNQGGAGGKSSTKAGAANKGGAAGNAGAASGGAAGAAGTSAHTGTWKLMPLGDSITASTCYPQIIAQKLKDAGHGNFEFVGSTTTNQSCPTTGAPSVTTEAHGGYGVTWLPADTTRTGCTKNASGNPVVYHCGSYAELQTWAAERPDVVLFHYGTNDVWDNESVANILDTYAAVIQAFRNQNSSVVFFVSKIIKLSPSGCTDCPTRVSALVSALTDSWASSNSTAFSPIYLVDNYGSGFDPTSSADTTDGVHPTEAGALKSAMVTVAAIVAKLDRI